MRFLSGREYEIGDAGGGEKEVLLEADVLAAAAVEIEGEIGGTGWIADIKEEVAGEGEAPGGEELEAAAGDGADFVEEAAGEFDILAGMINERTGDEGILLAVLKTVILQANPTNAGDVEGSPGGDLDAVGDDLNLHDRRGGHDQAVLRDEDAVDDVLDAVAGDDDILRRHGDLSATGEDDGDGSDIAADVDEAVVENANAFDAMEGEGIRFDINGARHALDVFRRDRVS